MSSFVKSADGVEILPKKLGITTETEGAYRKHGKRLFSFYYVLLRRVYDTALIS